jgi:hypothetical protein
VPEEFSPQPSTSTYLPTRAPSVTGLPTAAGGVGVTPDEVGDDDFWVVDVQSDKTTSNIARKVRIEHLRVDVGIISLKEVQVYDFDGNNVALGKPATQSTDFSISHVASMANDGNIDTFSHTASNGNNPWWEVDLETSVAIEQIHVVNRDCQSSGCLARLSYATLSLLDDSGNVIATRNFGDMSAQEEVDFDFSVIDALASDVSLCRKTLLNGPLSPFWNWISKSLRCAPMFTF